jgi:hypothetical protein
VLPRRNAEIAARLEVTPQRVSQLRIEALEAALRDGRAVRRLPAAGTGTVSGQGPVSLDRPLPAQASYAAAIAGRRTFVERISSSI